MVVRGGEDGEVGKTVNGDGVRRSGVSETESVSGDGASRDGVGGLGTEEETVTTDNLSEKVIVSF